MISITVIFFLVSTFNLIQSGGDGGTSLPELIDKVDKFSDQIQKIVKTATDSEKELKTKIPEAIHDFELLLRNIGDVENQAQIRELLRALNAPLTQASVSATPTLSNPSFQPSEECFDVADALNLIKELVLALEHELDHKDFAAELALIVGHIQALPFNPPLDNENHQLLVKGLAEIQQALDLISLQGQQNETFNNILSDIGNVKRHVSVICSLNGFNIEGRRGLLGGLLSSLQDIASTLISGVVSILGGSTACDQIQSAVNPLVSNFFTTFDAYVSNCATAFRTILDKEALIAKRDECGRTTTTYVYNFIKNLFTALKATNLPDLDVFLGIYSTKNITTLKCIQDALDKIIPFLIEQDGALYVAATMQFDSTLATLLPITDVTVSLGPNPPGPCAQIRATAVPLISNYFNAVNSFFSNCKASLKSLRDEGRPIADLLAKRDDCCLEMRSVYLIALIGELSTKLGVSEDEIFNERVGIHEPSLTCIAPEIATLIPFVIKQDVQLYTYTAQLLFQTV